ncbi:hypothetical protein HNR19_001010 [Nocardioides thalensis]|uniref:Lipoprotein n=1 Tax=Nocardioides thalensis TaxID=1914755 RepID=A0A853C0R1_9ACTN|nr:hypothetical protein [Nocardioides thalensis]NYJ00312.1 hypothetical protein [Nocardioides thalensis]
MTRVKLSLASAVAGVAILATGCGADNIVGGEPPAPGVAAEVEDATLDLEQVDVLTDAICSSLENDPTSQATSRAIVQTSVVAQWASAEVARALVEQQDVSLDVQPADYASIPGWDEFSEEEQEAVRTYIDAIQYLQAAVPEVGDEEGMLDTSEVDVTINPRFDLDTEGAIERADRQTSVAVSSEALVGTAEQLDPEQVEALPDSQLCGRRGTAPAAPPLAP